MDNKHTTALWYSIFMFGFWFVFALNLKVFALVELAMETASFEYKVLAVRDIVCLYSAVFAYGLTVLVLRYERFAKLAPFAKVLNYLLFVLLLAIVIYAFSGNTTMTKKIMRMELFGSIFVVIIPSVLNLRALAKIGK